MSFQWSYGGKGDADRARTASQPASVEDYDDALDAIARLLRAMSEARVDGGQETPDEWEPWAQHVLTLSQVPGAPPSTPPPRRRQWPALIRFFEKARGRECERVATAGSDLRAAVWTFVKGIARIASAGGQTDEKIGATIERLRIAATNPAPEALRRETMALVDELSTLVEERTKRQSTELASLGSQLRALGSELESAKRDGERDPLTKLLNRRAFDQCVARTVDLTNAFGVNAALVVADVDRFKTINDRYGHAAGDAALRAVADCLTRTFMRRGDAVARLGGDEFAIVLSDTAAKHAALATNRLLAAVRTLTVPHASESFRVTLSIGVSPSAAGRTADEWYAAADRALYVAKASGRNRAVVEGEEARRT